MDCAINGIPAWEHPKQQLRYQGTDATSISTGGGGNSSSHRIDDMTQPTSPTGRSTPSFLHLLPTRSNQNKREVPSSSNPIKEKMFVVPSAPVVTKSQQHRPPAYDAQPQQIMNHNNNNNNHTSFSSNNNSNHNRTPNTSMDHRNLLNMDGTRRPNKMMITFDSDAQSCCPSVGDITWDHTEAMAFQATSDHHRHLPQQQQHPWQNFQEITDETATNMNRPDGTNHHHQSRPTATTVVVPPHQPPRNKNRVFMTPTAAVAAAAAGATTQQHQQNQPKSTKPFPPPQPLQPHQPQPPRRNSAQHTTTKQPSLKSNSNDISLSPIRTTTSKQTTQSSVATTTTTTNEIDVNFSNLFLESQRQDDVPRMDDLESMYQQKNIAKRFSMDSAATNSGSISSSNHHIATSQTVVIPPFREKRNEHLRTIPPQKEHHWSGTTVTTSTTEQQPAESLNFCTTPTNQRRTSVRSNIFTVPALNSTTTTTGAQLSTLPSDRMDGLSKHSTSSGVTTTSRGQRQRHPQQERAVTTNPRSQHTPSVSPIRNNGAGGMTPKLPIDEYIRKKTPPLDGAALFQKLNISKSSISTSRSSKSVTSHRSSSYSTSQQLEESIQNLEATLQMKSSNHYHPTSRQQHRQEDDEQNEENEYDDHHHDDRLVDLALESSFNDIYLRPSTSEKRNANKQPVHQESSSTLTIMSSSILSSMSMNSNNSMTFHQQHQQQQQHRPPPAAIVMIIEDFNTITPANLLITTVDHTADHDNDNDFVDMDTAMAMSSTIRDLY